MKISEDRIKQIIVEEKTRLLNEQKVPKAKYALMEIAMLSAQMHDNPEALRELSEKDLRIIRNVAESLDIIFYKARSS